MEINKITERFDRVALNYDEQRKFFIPCYDYYYETSISFLSHCRNDFNSVLDLGAGTGLLTKHLFKEFPSAFFTLIDISDKMLEIARLRFENNVNIEYIIADYSEVLPQKKFDLIASALSIHHLENNSKIKLYSMIYEHLQNDGFFINLDQFNSNSLLINEHYNQWWYQYIENSSISENDRKLWLERRELDKENTIDETISMLKNIGFKDCECIYSFMKFGVVLAIK